jgi:hypothetical protein
MKLVLAGISARRFAGFRAMMNKQLWFTVQSAREVRVAQPFGFGKLQRRRPSCQPDYSQLLPEERRTYDSLSPLTGI